MKLSCPFKELKDRIIYLEVQLQMIEGAVNIAKQHIDASRRGMGELIRRNGISRPNQRTEEVMTKTRVICLKTECKWNDGEVCTNKCIALQPIFQNKGELNEIEIGVYCIDFERDN